MADVIRGYNVLQTELEKAKEVLKDVDENIKKLTGRDPNEARRGPRGGPNMGPPMPELRGNRERFMPIMGGRGRDFRPDFQQDFRPGFRPDFRGDDGPPPIKRRAFGPPGMFGRPGPRMDGGRRRRDEEDDDDELPRKPTVQSSVVATPKEQKTRKDCIEEQKTDEKGLQRNRRMFGLLLGTLQKFSVEEQKKKDKEVKRQEIERKLEEQVEKEKAELKRERQELFLERRKRQADLRRLEYKMELVRQLGEWEAYHRHLLNFVRTKTKPHLFYRPAHPNKCSEERLEESKKEIEAMIAEKRTSVEEEISMIEKRREAAAANKKVEAEPEEDLELEDEEEEIQIEMDSAVDEKVDDEPAGDEGKENIPEDGNGKPPASDDEAKPATKTEPPAEIEDGDICKEEAAPTKDVEVEEEEDGEDKVEEEEEEATSEL